MEALALDPSNNAAREFRNEVQQRLQSRRLQSRIDAILAEGDQALKQRRFAEATERFQSALQVYPENEKLKGRLQQARELLERSRAAAQLLADAGCFAIVLEAIPGPIAAYITSGSSIPTIGIGAGAACDGQVLVWHDVLGLTAGHVPQFVRKYADIGSQILEALAKYVSDVHAGVFPEPRHTYSMPDAEFERFESRRGTNKS